MCFGHQFDAIYAYKALYTAQWFTTVPEGERWGVIVDEENGTNKFSKWMHDASNGYEVLVDREGHNVSVTTTYPGANYSTAASAWWLEELNMTNPSSYNWNPVEYSDNRAWKTHSRVVADPTNNVIGAFSTSISLDFLSFQLDEIADHVPYPTLNYVFESVGNVSRIIATSDSDTDIYFRDAFSNIIGTETFESFAQRDEHVKPIYEWFLANRHGQLHEAEDVHDEEDEDAHHAEETHTEEGDEDSHGHSNSQLHSHHEMPSITLKLPTGQFQMMFTKITRDNLDWTLLTLVNRDKVMQPFDTSTRRTLGIVLAIVFTSFLFSLLFAWMLSKALHRITRDLSLLANFKFQDVYRRAVSGFMYHQLSSASESNSFFFHQMAHSACFPQDGHHFCRGRLPKQKDVRTQTGLQRACKGIRHVNEQPQHGGK
ncbi:hypothetical protein DFS34DRAFT_621588 [Phlyctochytrium arcticum]|nr:hypothetical protein DFS34DRAFT_621588 [Phlyctochytrium arcticum]